MDKGNRSATPPPLNRRWRGDPRFSWSRFIRPCRGWEEEGRECQKKRGQGPFDGDPALLRCRKKTGGGAWKRVHPYGEAEITHRAAGGLNRRRGPLWFLCSGRNGERTESNKKRVARRNLKTLDFVARSYSNNRPNIFALKKTQKPFSPRPPKRPPKQRSKGVGLFCARKFYFQQFNKTRPSSRPRHRPAKWRYGYVFAVRFHRKPKRIW